MSLKDKLDLQRLPRHIAIIMDGNGRWAKERGQDRLYGHHEGVESVRNIVTTCAELGIGYLTLYAFSTENWDRPVYEVNGIMELLVNTIRMELNTFSKNNIRLSVIGDMGMLPPQCQQEMEEAMALTSQNTGLNLIMALSYSARWEIVNAARKIALDVKSGALDPIAITPEVWEKYLCTAGLPDPELMIRTSGECRISNFLLYQLAYAELYFTDTRWPDFRNEHLYQAILNYQTRERRFGKTSEQIQQKEEIIS